MQSISSDSATGAGEEPHFRGQDARASSASAAATQVGQQSLDLDRQYRPAGDSWTPGSVFTPVLDRRGQHMLVRDEPDGGVRAIVPGGAHLIDRPDQRDVPLLWRHAYWRVAEHLTRDLAPTFVLDTTLLDAVRRQPEHAEWMFDRAAEQLTVVMRFLERRGTLAAESKVLARRRSLFVFLEIDAAASYYRERTGLQVPASARSALARARALVDGPALEGIAKLNSFVGTVVVRTGLLRLRRWEGLSIKLLMVFIKLFELQRALDEGVERTRLCERLRLLRGALELARYGTSRGSALAPLRALCDLALAADRNGRWNEQLTESLSSGLHQQAHRLEAGISLPRQVATDRRRPALLETDFELLAA
ncbi:MAG TPA: hypothetical protein VF533_19875 [Solirubrobacteraceae bacterium]|jgi:hypothetical protein